MSIINTMVLQFKCHHLVAKFVSFLLQNAGGAWSARKSAGARSADVKWPLGKIVILLGIRVKNVHVYAFTNNSLPHPLLVCMYSSADNVVPNNFEIVT